MGMHGLTVFITFNMQVIVPFAYKFACPICIQVCLQIFVMMCSILQYTCYHHIRQKYVTYWTRITNKSRFPFIFIDNKHNYKISSSQLLTFSIYAQWSFKQILETTNLWTSLKYICKPIKYSFKSKKVLVYESKNILLMLDNNFDVRFPTLRFLLCRCFLNRMS